MTRMKLLWENLPAMLLTVSGIGAQSMPQEYEAVLKASANKATSRQTC